MKAFIFSFFFIFTKIIYGQQNTCNCVVRLTERDFKLQSNISKESIGGYEKLRITSKKGNEWYKVVKDTLAFWHVMPIIGDSVSFHKVEVKKIPQIFLLPINFGVHDSIPLLAEPKNNAKILRYVFKKEFIKESDMNNHYWFSGCKNEFAKVLVYQEGEWRGWIERKFYYSNDLSITKKK